MEASRGVLCSVLVELVGSVEGPASGSIRDRRDGLREVEGLLHRVKRATAPGRITRGIL